MTAKGYCAKHDGEELALKKGSNTFSEQYDVDIAESTSGAARHLPRQLLPRRVLTRVSSRPGPVGRGLVAPLTPAE